MLDIEKTRFPFIKVTLRGAMTTEVTDEWQAMVEGLFAENKRFGVAYDFIEVPMPEVAILKRLAAWSKSQYDNASKLIVCSGIHIESPVLRGALKFMNALAPSPSPQAVFSTIEDTDAWVVEQLAGAGVAVPG